MPSFWIINPGADIVATSRVHLNNGKTVDLSNIPGNGYVAPRIAQINAALQAEVDTRIPLAQLPADDPDKTTDPDGKHLYWGNANGDRASEGAQATHLCARHTLVWLTYENGELTTHAAEVV